ncbi:MAG TPA: cupredoxin domain-containing protein [Gammaproteobacteria bacterium]|nr:cupredoxin domain-containing protein [Gammaproteobacteria bacterium]
MRKSMAAGLLAVLSILSVQVKAEDTPVFELIIKDHRFEPAALEIPAQKKVKLVVKNQDATPEEFESYELNREKVIPGNSQAVVFIGPLAAGEYPFFGEFNQATAQGKIVAK